MQAVFADINYCRGHSCLVAECFFVKYFYVTTEVESKKAWIKGYNEYLRLVVSLNNEKNTRKRRLLKKRIKVCKDYNRHLENLTHPNPIKKYNYEKNIYNININASGLHKWRSHV